MSGGLSDVWASWLPSIMTQPTMPPAAPLAARVNPSQTHSCRCRTELGPGRTLHRRSLTRCHLLPFMPTNGPLQRSPNRPPFLTHPASAPVAPPRHVCPVPSPARPRLHGAPVPRMPLHTRERHTATLWWVSMAHGLLRVSTVGPCLAGLIWWVHCHCHTMVDPRAVSMAHGLQSHRPDNALAAACAFECIWADEPGGYIQWTGRTRSGLQRPHYALRSGLGLCDLLIVREVQYWTRCRILLWLWQYLVHPVPCLSAGMLYPTLRSCLGQ